jgi:copper chaperone CopZ
MEKTFKVTGMHCPSCEMLIKDDLDDIGVKVKKISHKEGIVEVEFDSKKVTEIKIKTIIEHEGYKVVN